MRSSKLVSRNNKLRTTQANTRQGLVSDVFYHPLEIRTGGVVGGLVVGMVVGMVVDMAVDMVVVLAVGTVVGTVDMMIMVTVTPNRVGEEDSEVLLQCLFWVHLLVVCC